MATPRRIGLVADVQYADLDDREGARFRSSLVRLASVLERPLVHEPGTRWYYSGGLTQVLASMIRARTGQRLDDYARDRLFEPLGITEFEWLGPGGWEPDQPAARRRLLQRAVAGIPLLARRLGVHAARMTIMAGAIFPPMALFGILFIGIAILWESKLTPKARLIKRRLNAISRGDRN